MNTGLAILIVGAASLIAWGWTLASGSFQAIGITVLGGLILGIALSRWRGGDK